MVCLYGGVCVRVIFSYMVSTFVTNEMNEMTDKIILISHSSMSRGKPKTVELSF